jgi:hypothetical protein
LEVLEYLCMLLIFTSPSIYSLEREDILRWDWKPAIRLKRISPISPKSMALKKKFSGYEEISISSMPFSVRQRRICSRLKGCAEPTGRSSRIFWTWPFEAARGLKKVFLTRSMAAGMKPIANSESKCECSNRMPAE